MILNILLVIAGFTVGLFGRNFLPEYMKQKGKNLATKEDIEKITKITENTKALISSRLHVNQTRYIKEYELLEELSEKVVNLYLAVTKLRPILDYVDQNKDENEIKIERIEAYNKAGRRLYLLKERKRPFYPKNIYGKLRDLDDKSWKEVISYKNSDKNNTKYWDEALKNRESIEFATERVMKAIRERIQDWEKCDIQER